MCVHILEINKNWGNLFPVFLNIIIFIFFLYWGRLLDFSCTYLWAAECAVHTQDDCAASCTLRHASMLFIFVRQWLCRAWWSCDVQCLPLFVSAYCVPRARSPEWLHFIFLYVGPRLNCTLQGRLNFTGPLISLIFFFNAHMYATDDTQLAFDLLSLLCLCLVSESWC